MEQRFSHAELSQLLSIVTTIANAKGWKPAQAVADVERMARKERLIGPTCPTQFADRMRRFWITRRQIFQLDQLQDPTWEILLDLFIAHEKEKLLTVSDVCIGCSAPYTTALRHLDALSRAGLVERECDVTDKRRSYIKLTQGSATRLRAMIAQMIRALEV